MFQETRQPAKRWSRAERQRPVVAAGLGHCGTGMSPKGKGGRKKKRGRGVFFAGACFRCLDPWRGRLAVTHSRGSAQGWDRLVADRAGPIGRAVRRCGGCQGPRGCDWVFLVVTTFPLWLCWWIPIEASPVCVCDAGRQLGLWAAIRRARAASWQGLKTGGRPRWVTAPSSAQHHGIVHVRLCVCRRRPRATSDKRLASMVAAWGLVSVTADRRPQT